MVLQRLVCTLSDSNRATGDRREERGMKPEDRPQDSAGDLRGWTFKSLEHGGDEPDSMPQVIQATDAEGRQCLYVAPNGWLAEAGASNLKFKLVNRNVSHPFTPVGVFLIDQWRWTNLNDARRGRPERKR
jgi:hypothetical protein